MEISRIVKNLFSNSDYKTRTSGEAEIETSNCIKSVLKENNSLIKTPISAYTLPKYVKTEQKLSPKEIMNRFFFEMYPDFWHHKSVLDLGCAHDIVAKILVDMHGSEFDYVGLDIDKIDFKYSKDTKGKKNIYFSEKTDMNTLAIDSFNHKFDRILYFGVQLENLGMITRFLNQDGYLIYSPSICCWNIKTHRKICANDLKLKQQIWLLGEYSFSKINTDAQKQFLSINGFLLYKK